MKSLMSLVFIIVLITLIVQATLWSLGNVDPIILALQKLGTWLLDSTPLGYILSNGWLCVLILLGLSAILTKLDQDA